MSYKRVVISPDIEHKLVPGTPLSVLDPVHAIDIRTEVREGRQITYYSDLSTFVKVLQRLNDVPLFSFKCTAYVGSSAINAAIYPLILKHLDIPTLRSVSLRCDPTYFGKLAAFLSRSGGDRSLDTVDLMIEEGAAPRDSVITGPQLVKVLAALSTHTRLRKFHLSFCFPLAREAVSALVSFIASAPALTTLGLVQVGWGTAEYTPRSYYDELYNVLKARRWESLKLELPLDGARLGDAIGANDRLRQLTVRLCPTLERVQSFTQDANISNDANEEMDLDDGGSDSAIVDPPEQGLGNDDADGGPNGTDSHPNDQASEHSGSDDDDDDDDDEGYYYDPNELRDDNIPGPPGWEAPITIEEGLEQYAPFLSRLVCPQLGEFTLKEKYERGLYLPALLDALRRLPAPETLSVWSSRLPDRAAAETYVRDIIDALSASTSIRWVDIRPTHFSLQTPFGLAMPPGRTDITAQAKELASPQPWCGPHDLQLRMLEMCIRNGTATERVRAAVLRALPFCRILLCTNETVPPAVAGMITADENSNRRKTNWNDLPYEVRLLIARHTSGDADALSDRQWAALSRHCADRSTIRRAIENGRNWHLDDYSEYKPLDYSEQRFRAISEREYWLESLGLGPGVWERNVPSRVSVANCANGEGCGTGN